MLPPGARFHEVIAMSMSSATITPRPMLHALSLSVRHPRGGELSVEAPLPADFLATQSFLRDAR